ncbi:MAG TPA: indolepyruvate oxidoreductase subunit beta [Longimicrobiales bacterium]|nr:indolepyruvate oxidoreductase subunit beta [Longimicrobiales bacterium]
MKTDIVLCGVGGQGVLSAAAILAEAAVREGLEVRQGEVHGMAQRGGAVQASLRISDLSIAGELIPRGTADLLLSLEPLETLRYLDWLGPRGWVVAAAEPVRNITDYPPLEEVHARLLALPRVRLVEAGALARKAGSIHAANVVLLGTASPLLPLAPRVIREVITEGFMEKGVKVVDANLRAFHAGEELAAAP